MTTRDVLTQYLMGIPNDSATLLKVKYSADTIAFHLKETHQTFDFIQLLNSDEILTCFLHELTLQPLYWHVIYSILSAAKLMHDASIGHEQGFRIHEIINKILSFMVNNDIVQWIETSGGWEHIDVTEY